jgi:cytochrome c-type biogenesis protein CcmH/NrfG
MAVKTEKELSEGLRALWLKAVAAIELRNFGYAISLLQEILKQEPEFSHGPPTVATCGGNKKQIG